MSTLEKITILASKIFLGIIVAGLVFLASYVSNKSINSVDADEVHAIIRNDIMSSPEMTKGAVQEITKLSISSGIMQGQLSTMDKRLLNIESQNDRILEKLIER